MKKNKPLSLVETAFCGGVTFLFAIFIYAFLSIGDTPGDTRMGITFAAAMLMGIMSVTVAQIQKNQGKDNKDEDKKE